MARAPFLDRARGSSTTSLGPVELPVLYRDLSSVLAFFRVEYGRAADVLAATPFMPVRFATGFAVAGLAMFDYRDTTLGPYRECALTVAALPRGRRTAAMPVLDLLRRSAHRELGFYVLDLPVTTVLADAAGRELWGLPKFVTTIDLRVDADRVRGVVASPAGGEPIVALEGRAKRGFAVPAMDLVVYSVHGGQPLRTVAQARGRMRTCLGGELAVRVGATSPMSSHLRALALDGARPSLAQSCEHGQMVLGAGEPMVRARAA